jgi:hypothetical protein
MPEFVPSDKSYGRVIYGDGETEFVECAIFVIVRGRMPRCGVRHSSVIGFNFHFGRAHRLHLTEPTWYTGKLSLPSDESHLALEFQQTGFEGF